MLGSERHESRRIDNQLRGRSGRQGDPGESRFFLSLEDELMRLFATGAMNWVMGRALPDDVPIESKMVTKAIERAQNTVEGRNAEIRKDVLKYDEVMNEQRKVIYARRMQILEGEDLRARTIEVLSSALGHHRRRPLRAPTTPRTGTSTGCSPRPACTSRRQRRCRGLSPQRPAADEIYEALAAEAIAYYETREEPMPGGAETMRALEREVMLQLIDQKWREHLSEMDYLREGIGLRAMGQQDPLVAWQREGYDMFGQLMSGIDDDYVKIVMHAQVQSSSRTSPTSRGPPRGHGTRQRTTRCRGSRASSGPWPPGPRPARRSSSRPRTTPVPGWRRGAGGLVPMQGGAAERAEGQAAQRAAAQAGIPVDVPVVKDSVWTGRPQRPLPVRERQEVQVLPRAIERTS